MKLIPSFKIDHTCLKPGLYTSQHTTLGPYATLETLDIRVVQPYAEPAMSPAVAHTIEHIGATFLRNRWPQNTIYFGPMGCLTGFYLILHFTRGIPEPFTIVTELFEYIKTANTIPGATEKACGNYTLMDLDGAKQLASKYLSILLKDKDKYHGKIRYSY